MKYTNCFLYLFILTLSANSIPLFAEDEFTDIEDFISFTAETDQIIVELVESAYYLDSYNERCRGYGASMKVDDVSDLIYQKYHARVNDVLQRYRDTNIFRARDAIQRNFFKALGENGGCQAAETNGFEEKLNLRYRQLFKSVEAAP